MNVHPDVNFEELARSTDDFNGAQLKAVCVEAGMLALRRDATEVINLSPSLSNYGTSVVWLGSSGKFLICCWYPLGYP